jgi:hypothetical protein
MIPAKAGATNRTCNRNATLLFEKLLFSVRPPVIQEVLA